MAWKKSLYLLSAIGIGALFYRLHVPAGCLIGALLTGICCSLYFQRFVFSNNVFQVALALVGTNIGFMLHPDLLATLYLYFIPLLITLPLTLGGGYLLGKILSRYSSLDPLTALFSCIPGGASEVIILSNEYDADQRIVAAFHTARITFFVLTVPFFVALTQHGQQLSRVRPSVEMLAPLELIVLLLCISSAFIFTKLVKKIPAGILFISMLIAFLVNQYLFPLGDPPPFLAGIGQAWLGAMIGIRF